MKKIFLALLVLIAFNAQAQTTLQADKIIAKILLSLTDSSKLVPNTNWVKRQLYAQKVAAFTPGSVPFANASGILDQDATGLYYDGNNLTVGHSGFSNTVGLRLNDGRATILASGFGMTLLMAGGTPVDPSKHMRFYNNYYEYGQFNTTGVAGSWAHWFDLFTNVRVRSLSTDSVAPTSRGTTKMVTVDRDGLLSFATIPSGGGGGSWGSITGTLSSQTDLNSALSGKQTALSGTGYLTFSGTTPTYVSVIPNSALANAAVALLSGTNSGDNSTNTLYSGLVTNATHTGDATGSTALTLATVNSNVGSFGSSTSVPAFTVNGKGLITAASATAIPTATTGITGLLTSTDYNTFNGKQAALGFTPYNATNPNGYIPLTSLSATTPIFYNNTTGVISSQAATTSLNGYLTNTDWNTFNGKAPLASPTFTGVPVAPTATVGTNTTQLATTAFVQAQVTATPKVYIANNAISYLQIFSGVDDSIGGVTATANQVLRSGNAGGKATMSALTYQDIPLSLTTTGSGAATYTSGVLNVPIPATGGDVYLANTQTFTGVNTYKGTTASDGGQLGSEQLTTGSSSGGWGGTSFTSGYLHTAGTANALTSAVTPASGFYYKITIVSTGSVGTFTFTVGGYTSGTISFATITITPKLLSSAALVITPTSTYDGTITASIKVVSSSSAAQIWTNSAGATTLEYRPPSDVTNQVIGLSAAPQLTTGAQNTGNGNNVFQKLTSGSLNTALGYQVLYNNDIGNGNTGAGAYALLNNSSGNNNTGIGDEVMISNTTGSINVAAGQKALNTNTIGSNNIALGGSAGRYISGGSTSALNSNNSIFIGGSTFPLADGQSNQVVIAGGGATGLGSNTNLIGNSSSVTTGIFGNLALQGTTNTLVLPTTNTATGTTGAQTISKARGKVNFAAAATSLVVTNTLVTTASHVQVQVEGTDGTAKSATVTLAAGSFTITLNAAATAETKVSFMVTN